MADQDDQIIKFIGFAQLGELSEMRALMRRYNLDVNVSYDVSGTTALLAAISFNQASCVEWLINNGADVNLGDKEGRAPLHYAAKVSKALAYKLLQHHAAVNARARNGMTPLHCAFQSQQLDIAVLLLNNGADISARDAEKRLPTDLATDLFVNEVHRRTRRRYVTADQLSAQVSEEEVHEPAHVPEEIEEPAVTRAKSRPSPRKHREYDDASELDEIELLRSALRDAQRALEQSNSKQVQQAITLYKQAALTRKAEVDSMAVRMRELEAELHAKDVEIRELKRRIDDMRANQRLSRGNTPAKRKRSPSQSPRPNKRRRVSGRQQSREEDEVEEQVEDQVEEGEDDASGASDSESEDDASAARQTPNVRTRSASKQTSSAKSTPRQKKSPTQPRTTPKTSKQQKRVSSESEDESAAESSESSSSASEKPSTNKKTSGKGKESSAKHRKSDANKTAEVSISIIGTRKLAGNNEWRVVNSAGGTKTWMSQAEMKKKYGIAAVQAAFKRYEASHEGTRSKK